MSHRVITVISNVNKHLAANCTFVLDFKLGKVDLRGHDRIKCCGFGRAIQYQKHRKSMFSNLGKNEMECDIECISWAI